MSYLCISYVNICSIIIIVVGGVIIVVVDMVVVVVVVVSNTNFLTFHPGCLSTRRRHSQIRKEDHSLPCLPANNIQSLFVRR